MDSGLSGKTALVTGGGTGIGRAIALALAAEEVDVAIASRKPRPETIQELEAHGVKALRLCHDLSQETEVLDMVQRTLAVRIPTLSMEEHRQASDSYRRILENLSHIDRESLSTMARLISICSKPTSRRKCSR